MFGVEYSTLDITQQSIIHALCTYSYNLRVIEKVSDTNPNAKSSELGQNNLLKLPLVSGGESTSMFKGEDGYVYPLTFEVVGVKDMFLGVKANLYNPREMKESAVFLPTNHASWIFQNDVLYKK